MSTYTPIASQTLSSVASSVVFNNIPQNFTDLVLVSALKNNGPTFNMNIVLNNDTATNYSCTRLYGSGIAASSDRFSNTAQSLGGWGFNANTGMISPVITHLQNYSNTSTFKTFLTRLNTGNSLDKYLGAVVSLWRSTSAVTSVEFKFTDNIAAGSTFNIYGIQSGNPLATKASGGNIIVSDGTYWYHAFTSSGYFTPSAALTADILVIAGGGSGGGNVTAGAGAGGVVSLTSQSLTAINYAVAVGAGAVSYNSAQSENGNNSQFGSLTAALGGGASGIWQSGTQSNGIAGGSGGGGAGKSGTGGASLSGQGNAGGNGVNPGSPYGLSGGGGGAGGVGGNASGSTPGAGGVGTSSFSSWGAATGTGHNVGGTRFYAGGGTGGGYVDSSNWNTFAGGNGGGGSGSTYDASNGAISRGGNGMANTGGGGGGGGSSGGRSGNGGSGIIIVRYLV